MLNSHDHWAYNGLTDEKKKKIFKTKTSFTKIPILSYIVIQPLKKNNNIISNACNELSFFSKIIYYLRIFTPFPPSLVKNYSWAKLFKAGLR